MATPEQGCIRLARELRAWTRLVVDQAAADPLAMADTSLLCMDFVRRAFRAVSRLTTDPSSFLARLPTHVLKLVCEHLSFPGRVALAHVSSNLRARLLSMPQIWANISSLNSYIAFRPIRPEVTAQMLQRSAGQRLAMSLSISEENASRWLPVLTAHSDRISSLHIFITWRLDPMAARGPSRYFWVATMEALHASMPQLRHLRLGISCVSDDDDWWLVLRPHLTLSAGLLADNSPVLRSCQFSGISLDLEPAMEFRNMTCFAHSWDERVDIEDIARILAHMPVLRTLGITVSTLDASSWISDANWTISHRSLRNLELRVYRVQSPSSLRPLLTIKSLRHLDLCLAHRPAAIIAEAYPGSNVARVVIAPGGGMALTVSDGPLGSTTTTIYIVASAPGQYNVATACASTLTWLAIHELEYAAYSELPVLPTVETLILRLASCVEQHSADAFKSWSVNSETFFTSPTITWHLSSLRYFCVSAPPRCATPASQCVCAPPMSISLRDVAHFIRAGLRFDGAPMLDAVRLAGLRVIDLDFCTAWGELQSCTRTVDLVEEPDVIKHMDASLGVEVGLEARFAARE